MKRVLSARAAMAIVACVSGLVAAACASNAPTAILADTRWTVASLNGEPVAEAVSTIEFSGDRISGSGGCNRYFGGYEVTGAETLVIRGIGSTEMACEPAEIMTREQGYFTALNAVRSYRRDGDQLTLSAVAGPTIVLQRRP
ncbi:MAG: META domain-containing protein [Caulobacteraceae bacterium]